MSVSMSEERQVAGIKSVYRPKVTTVTDRRTRKIIDMDISTARAQRIKRMAKLFALVKDIAALFAVALFVFAIIFPGNGIEQMILTARGQ